ncbi:hypothetical protein COU14_03355 [Candidatus Kaiserbacteria bacterium CG10_big_fil_rev_8_21_14_0_10_44_10]|uniref:Zinc-ribbon domain-containing protein n=1 Tax=Candidatus Kaiserbacteria bacterium CG10_big_fil_rev_8_21_14_0_10_44_10 TaxID=1974606 RepID=A0A2H0UIK1_9BACT|nr:MAG: hypothetical protein COU14_03355 [Candidatus Kaiserbacteria bacterium CG10_big_fil_rev_8_21_14_0_10_44_10]
MHCKHCGNKIVEGAKFCAKCGQQVGSATPAHKPKDSGMSTGAKIVLAIAVGIPTLGILSSIILATLNTAREKASTVEQSEQLGASWQKFSPVGGRFSVLLPSYPTVDSSTDTTEDGTSYTYNSYVSIKGEVTFNVFQWVYADTIDISDPQELLQLLLNNFANGTGGELVSSDFSSNGELPAVDFLIKVDQQYIKGQLALNGQIPYLLAIEYRAGEYVDSDYQQFISSFEAK